MLTVCVYKAETELPFLGLCPQLESWTRAWMLWPVIHGARRDSTPTLVGIYCWVLLPSLFSARLRLIPAWPPHFWQRFISPGTEFKWNRNWFHHFWSPSDGFWNMKCEEKFEFFFRRLYYFLAVVYVWTTFPPAPSHWGFHPNQFNHALSRLLLSPSCQHLEIRNILSDSTKN